MVHIHIDVRDALNTLGEKPCDGHANVVVDAKASSLPRHRMMQSSGDVDGMLGTAGVHFARRSQRRPRDECRSIVHPGEDRVVRGAETAHEVDRTRIT